ncbi:MAG: SDR family oxidoreductase [Alphaproteobacteria bacterium]|nr:SDR family oxidoreductase [Alphaproteobacteria bacterium]
MKKKIALVTGASSGIGKSVSIFLAENDYFVILLARNEERLKNVKDQIEKTNNSAIYYSVDVSNSMEIQSCVNNIISKYGHIDLLFNNAGILKQGTITLSDNEIDELLKINLNGAIYVAKYIAEQMKKQKSGYIINMSSMGGKTAASFAGIYAASKFGLSGFSEALAKEMSNYNVKVTNLYPHMTATEMTVKRKFKPEKMIQTDDICKTIWYLLNLSKNAVPLEVAIHCMAFIKKNALASYKMYGFK